MRLAGARFPGMPGYLMRKHHPVAGFLAPRRSFRSPERNREFSLRSIMSNGI